MLPNDSLHSVQAAINYIWQLTNRASLEHTTEFFVNTQDSRDMQIYSETDFSVQIIKHLALAVSLTIQFDNRPVMGFKKLDTIEAVSLAVTF